MKNWISVKDQLPDYGLGVLITDGKIVTAAIRCKPYLDNQILNWDGYGFSGYEWEFDFDTNSITHWMPLPEPPT